MTGAGPNDPLGYAAEELMKAGVPVTVDRSEGPLSAEDQYAGIQDHRELVKRFKRSSGWAVVGRDPIRYNEKVNGYNGMERRKAA